MQNLYNDLKELLLQNEQYVIDGKLNKPKIEDDGLNLDVHLLKLLLQNTKLKKHFFQDVDGVMAFDKVKFQRFINNKQFLPDCYTEFKNKIGLTVNSKFLTESKEVVLDFPYKDCVLQGCQDREDAKRDEVFFNETLAPDDIDMLLEPKVLTGFKKYDANGCHEVTDVTMQNNFIIKGNNLLALHSLKRIYRGKVKLIYIDPPYNTGNDGFKYNDKFNHSTWLTFMKNRLEIAKELLRDDGVIFVQCDNKEVAYLKVLMDEVFGRNNYKNSIITRKGVKSVQNQFETIDKLNAGFDTILFFTKNNNMRLPHLKLKLNGEKTSGWNNFWRGTDRDTMRYKLFDIVPESGQWRWKESRANIAITNYQNLIKFIKSYGESQIDDGTIDEYYKKYCQANSITDTTEFELLRLSKNGKPEHYIPSSFEVTLGENWMDIYIQGNLTKFEHEKSELIIYRLINWLTTKNDIVLDYHLGSGTTAAVAHKMGRRYIGIEQMDYIDELVITRLKNVIGINKNNKTQLIVDEGYQDYDISGISKTVNWCGGGSFIYCELMRNNQIWVDKINHINDSEQLIKLWQLMQDKAQLSYKVDISQINANINKFEQLSLEEQKRFLIEVLDKNQLYVNYTEIDDVDYLVSDAYKQLNHKFYSMK